MVSLDDEEDGRREGKGKPEMGEVDQDAGIISSLDVKQARKAQPSQVVLRNATYLFPRRRCGAPAAGEVGEVGAWIT